MKSMPDPANKGNGMGVSGGGGGSHSIEQGNKKVKKMTNKTTPKEAAVVATDEAQVEDGEDAESSAPLDNSNESL